MIKTTCGSLISKLQRLIVNKISKIDMNLCQNFVIDQIIYGWTNQSLRGVKIKQVK